MSRGTAPASSLETYDHRRQVEALERVIDRRLRSVRQGRNEMATRRRLLGPSPLPTTSNASHSSPWRADRSHPPLDRHEGNHLVANNFATTPDLTPVEGLFTESALRRGWSAWTIVASAVKRRMRQITISHSLLRNRRAGLYLAGSATEVSNNSRERIMLLVLELSDHELHVWREVHPEMEQILRDFGMDGEGGVCIRYYCRATRRALNTDRVADHVTLEESSNLLAGTAAPSERPRFLPLPNPRERTRSRRRAISPPARSLTVSTPVEEPPWSQGYESLDLARAFDMDHDTIATILNINDRSTSALGPDDALDSPGWSRESVSGSHDEYQAPAMEREPTPITQHTSLTRDIINHNESMLGHPSSMDDSLTETLTDTGAAAGDFRVPPQPAEPFRLRPRAYAKPHVSPRDPIIARQKQRQLDRMDVWHVQNRNRLLVNIFNDDRPGWREERLADFQKMQEREWAYISNNPGARPWQAGSPRLVYWRTLEQAMAEIEAEKGY